MTRFVILPLVQLHERNPTTNPFDVLCRYNEHARAGILELTDVVSELRTTAFQLKTTIICDALNVVTEGILDLIGKRRSDQRKGSLNAV